MKVDEMLKETTKTYGADEISELPPVVEGVEPSDMDMLVKQTNGRFYMDDVWKICREYTSADVYTTKTDLPSLASALAERMAAVGYEIVDESSRFDSIKNAFQLAEEWACVTREARTQRRMIVVRRTPTNSGALLVLQRIEHLRGQCSELAPLAYVVLVCDEQRFITRDLVAPQESTEDMLLTLARHLVEEESAPAMPEALFRQQLKALQTMMIQMQLPGEMDGQVVASDALFELDGEPSLLSKGET